MDHIEHICCAAGCACCAIGGCVMLYRRYVSKPIVPVEGVVMCRVCNVAVDLIREPGESNRVEAVCPRCKKNWPLPE